MLQCGLVAPSSSRPGFAPLFVLAQRARLSSSLEHLKKEGKTCDDGAKALCLSLCLSLTLGPNWRKSGEGGARGRELHSFSIPSLFSSFSAMSSALSSRSRSCSCSRPAGALASAATGAAGSRGTTVPAPRRAPKRGLVEAIRSRRPSSSTSTSTTAAAAAAAKKAAPQLPLPSLPSLPSLPKFYFGGSRLSKAKAKLLALVSKTERGTNPDGPSRGEIEAAIDELYAAAPRSALFPLEKNPAGIDGKWKLVSREEKEEVSDLFFRASSPRGREREEKVSFSSFPPLPLTFSSVV